MPYLFKLYILLPKAPFIHKSRVSKNVFFCNSRLLNFNPKMRLSYESLNILQGKFFSLQSGFNFVIKGLPQKKQKLGYQNIHTNNISIYT